MKRKEDSGKKKSPEALAGLRPAANNNPGQYALLFALAKETVQIRAKQDLMKLIREKFRALFYFYHCTICILNEDKKSYRAFLLDPESKIRVHERYRHLISSSYSLANGIDDVIIASHEPVIFDFDEIVAAGRMPPHGMIIYEAGVHGMIGKALEIEQERFGFLVFYTDKKGSFNESHLEIVENVAAIISPVVANILTNEKLEQKVKEQNAALLISDAISSIRNRSEFLDIINIRLKQLFRFTHSIVLRFSDDASYLTTFLLDPNSRSRTFANYSDIVAIPLSVEDSLVRQLLQSKRPQLIDIEEAAGRTGAHPYLEMNLKTGLEEIAAVLLRHEDQTPMGLVYFYSDEKGTFTDTVLNLIHGISYHLSTAINNILHHESVLRHNRENGILLEISNELVSIRNKNDLGNIIAKSLKKYFRYDDSHILLYHSESGTYRTYIYHVSEKRIRNPDFLELVNTGIEKETAAHDHSHTPVIIDVEALKNAGIGFGIKAYRAGVREFIRVKLTDANELIGMLILLSDERKTFNDNSKSLLQNISFQFSKAISNLIAREEILRRDKENEALLLISEAISSIRDKRDLMRVVNQHLKSVLRFTDLAISIYNPDLRNYKVFLHDCPTMGVHANFGPVADDTHPLDDGIHDRAIASELPVLLTFEELDRMEQPHIKFMLGAGIKELIVVRLQHGNQIIGGMVLMSDLENALSGTAESFLRRVSHQIATSVSNIIAYEEIEIRDTEKTMLLSFGKSIASVRDKAGLERVMDQFFPAQFHIRNYVITAKNEDALTHSYYLFDKSGDYEQIEGFDGIRHARWRMESDSYDLSYTSYAPVFFNPDRLLNETGSAGTHSDFWKKAGMEKWLGISLRAGDENVGILWTRPKAANDLLLNGLASQIGFAITNIQAIDKINAQFSEINNYKEQLEEQNQYLQEEAQSGFTYADIIGSGPAMQKVFLHLTQVSFANSTVLILGETGTGKELIARAIHNSSPRKDKLMVKVNCAALPANLIESELFGHEKGSFTGATERRIGKFELASKGTLFLDEIGEMPIDLQVKLLRALQEKEIERIGGKDVIKVDVRIIAATNRDLEKEVGDGKFRADLFYRLNVFPITLPALRDRPEDIPTLATHFLNKFVKNTGKKINSISLKAMEDLMSYQWPGNVRELEHLMERSVLMTTGNTIREMHLPAGRKQISTGAEEDQEFKTFEENEKAYIMKALEKCKGKVFGRGGAAELLDLNVATLNSKIKKLGIQKETSFFRKK